MENQNINSIINNLMSRIAQNKNLLTKAINAGILKSNKSSVQDLNHITISYIGDRVYENSIDENTIIECSDIKNKTCNNDISASRTHQGFEKDIKTTHIDTVENKVHANLLQSKNCSDFIVDTLRMEVVKFSVENPKILDQFFSSGKGNKKYNNITTSSSGESCVVPTGRGKVMLHSNLFFYIHLFQSGSRLKLFISHLQLPEVLLETNANPLRNDEVQDVLDILTNKLKNIGLNVELKSSKLLRADLAISQKVSKVPPEYLNILKRVPLMQNEVKIISKNGIVLKNRPGYTCCAISVHDKYKALVKKHGRAVANKFPKRYLRIELQCRGINEIENTLQVRTLGQLIDSTDSLPNILQHYFSELVNRAFEYEEMSKNYHVLLNDIFEYVFSELKPRFKVPKLLELLGAEAILKRFNNDLEASVQYMRALLPYAEASSNWAKVDKLRNVLKEFQSIKSQYISENITENSQRNELLLLISKDRVRYFGYPDTLMTIIQIAKSDQYNLQMNIIPSTVSTGIKLSEKSMSDILQSISKGDTYSDKTSLITGTNRFICNALPHKERRGYSGDINMFLQRWKNRNVDRRFTSLLTPERKDYNYTLPKLIYNSQ